MASVETADIVIAGGAGMGSAVAYFLKSLGPDNLRIIVCEPDPTYARAATTLAAGGIRQQFSTPENIVMSQYGFDFLRRIDEELAIDGEGPQVDLHVVPYLHLAAGGKDVDGLRESFQLQSELGAGPLWLERDDLRARYPWMTVDDIDAAVLGGPREGVFDPYAMLQAFRRKAVSLGVEYRPVAVTGIEPASGAEGVTITLSDGGRLACGRIINCAGPAAGRLAALAGLDLPVIPVRAHSFVFKVEQAPTANLFPIIVDQVQLLNIRAEGDMFLAGSPREGELVDAGDNFAIDYDFFDTELWPMLATRVPAFEAIRMTSAWVGHMEWSLLDANPIIGPHPDFPAMVFVNGFSGHGVQHCPAVGRAVAELIVFGAYRSIDLSRFSYDRIAAGQPLMERY